MRYPCGCQNEIHRPSGVLHSVSKCPKHRAKQRDPATLDQRYYKELGVIKDGMLQQTNHLAELAEALGPFPEPNPYSDDLALEIGCGISPYAFALEEAGWVYVGIDPSASAIDFMGHAHDALYLRCDFETFNERKWWGRFGLILAAHVLEHLHDPSAALAKCSRLMDSSGELWIIVPDDSDPVNPDHLWFFTEATLRSTIEAAGLEVVKMAVRKYVAHERFIYCRARKP